MKKLTKQERKEKAAENRRIKKERLSKKKEKAS